MRATTDDLPVLVRAGEATVRAADWGGMRVVVVSVPAGTDFGPLLKVERRGLALLLALRGGRASRNLAAMQPA